MLKKNINIINVDFQIMKGLMLKWNLNGNLNNIYLHHVLVIDVKRF